MEALTTEVQNVFQDLVLTGDWLSNATKRLAEIKIDNIVHNIGYPDDIIDEHKLLDEIEGVTFTTAYMIKAILIFVPVLNVA